MVEDWNYKSFYVAYNLKKEISEINSTTPVIKSLPTHVNP